MKFAYMIMAHDNEWQLEKLLQLLDFSDNDIYLHIDKKNLHQFHIERLRSLVNKADLHVFSVYQVYWADISQTECQMFLLKQAVKNYHDYYHLLSGHDLPIKPHYEIVNFFEKINGTQLVHFESHSYCRKEQCRRYYFFDKYLRENGCDSKFYKLNEWLLKKQQKFGIEHKLYFGANWYSITHELATEYVRATSKMLRKVRFSRSSDEYILQTYLKMSKKQYVFYDTHEDDYHSIMRYIDWKRGNPYVWREQDYDELIYSEYLFARKFDEKIDKRVIERIYKYLMEKQENMNE